MGLRLYVKIKLTFVWFINVRQLWQTKRLKRLSSILENILEIHLSCPGGGGSSHAAVVLGPLSTTDIKNRSSNNVINCLDVWLRFYLYSCICFLLHKFVFYLIHKINLINMF